MLTIERLRELFSYDSETGLFTRIKSISSRAQAGTVAGNYVSGYIRIGIDGTSYMAHHLAWFWTHGVWPADQLDHRNRKRDDNRLRNLREATNKQNMANKGARPGSLTGFRGITLEHGKYHVRRQWDGQRVRIGTFSSLQDAVAAYREEAVKRFGEFAMEEDL